MPELFVLGLSRLFRLYILNAKPEYGRGLNCVFIKIIRKAHFKCTIILYPSQLIYSNYALYNYYMQLFVLLQNFGEYI